MERNTHYVTPEMKVEIQRKKDASFISEKIKQDKAPHKALPSAGKKVRFVLPDEFSGKDLKRAKKLIKKKK